MSNEGPQDQPITEVDDSEADSALGDDISALTESIRSSVYNYRHENGRRYHAYGRSEYLLPNDEAEQERLDLAHLVLTMALSGALYTAPIEKPARVLDVGTGTGIWAIELADELPSTIVVGTDISPIQPDWTPPNCQFYIDDAESPWMFEEPFDLIHGRVLCGDIGDWPEFYRQAYESLNPGGWMEMQEHECRIRSDDDTISQAPAIQDWSHNMDVASTRTGKRLNVAHLHRQWMIDAGFVDVAEDIHKLPIGSWPKDPKLKEIGRINRVQVLEAVSAYTIALYTRVLGHTMDQTQIAMMNIRKEFSDRELHLYLNFHVVRGRRPL